MIIPMFINMNVQLFGSLVFMYSVLLSYGLCFMGILWLCSVCSVYKEDLYIELR